MTSFPYSLRKALVQSGLEKASIELVEVKSTTPKTQPISGITLSSTLMSEVSNTLSTEQKDQIILASGSTKQQQGIPIVSVISTIPMFIYVSTISTIVSPMASAMIVET